jgi:hypothetical protein
MIEARGTQRLSRRTVEHGLVPYPCAEARMRLGWAGGSRRTVPPQPEFSVVPGGGQLRSLVEKSIDNRGVLPAGFFTASCPA